MADVDPPTPSHLHAPKAQLGVQPGPVSQQRLDACCMPVKRSTAWLTQLPQKLTPTTSPNAKQHACVMSCNRLLNLSLLPQGLVGLLPSSNNVPGM